MIRNGGSCNLPKRNSTESMPEPVSPLEEQLKALFRLSAPGEVRKALRIHELGKKEPRSRQDQDAAPGNVSRPPATPVVGVPQNRRAGRRRRQGSRLGGVLFPRDKKTSYAVNIRPKNWGNKDKIWIGRIKTYAEAQRTADIVFHYTGTGAVHNPDAARHFPPFLNDNLRFLDNMEDRRIYVMRIAKGDQFQAQRKEFSHSVKDMVHYFTAGHGLARQEIVEAVQETFPTATQNTRELYVEEFEETCEILSSWIPTLQQDDVEQMMQMLPRDAF